MVDRPQWVSSDIDPERPSVARIHDYWLGDAHNFTADRAVANRLMNHRNQAELTSLVQDLRILDPGVVRMPYWHPEASGDVGEAAARFPGYAALGRRW